MLKGNQGAGQPRSGAVEKQAHAKSLRSLHRHQAQLAPDVIRFAEPCELRFIEVGPALEMRDPLLDAAAKARADFNSFRRDQDRIHGRALTYPAPEILFRRLKVFPDPADTKLEPACTPDYGFRL
jgi:hypothetical protein